MRGQKNALDLATERSLAALDVYFYAMIEEVEKACVP